MEEALIESTLGVRNLRTSEVRIFDNEEGSVKVITLYQSGNGEMHIELIEE